MTFTCKICNAPATHVFRCDEHYRCDDCGTRVAQLCFFTDGLLCRDCKGKRIVKAIAEFKGDTDCTDDVICPWCGYKHGDSWEFEEGEQECSDCGRQFELTRSVEISYSTTKVTPS